MERSGEFPTVDDVDGLRGSDLDRALVELERARRRLEAAYLAVLDAADRQERYRADGHASVKGWAIALGRTSPVETHRRLQSMRALRDLPATHGALAAGAVGVDHVREIARLHANPRARDLIVDAEDQILTHAVKLGFDDFDEVARRWHAFADPCGARRAADRAHDQRTATIIERDGVFHLHACCGAAQGAAIKEILDRQTDAELLADCESAAADPTTSGLSRTLGQRRMDALHTTVLRSAAVPADAATPEPVVNIVMTTNEYQEALAHGLGGPRPSAATVDDIDQRRCQTLHGTQLDHRDAIAAAVTGHVRRVVVDAAGVVTDLGARRRFVGGARDAVLLTNGRRCTWPGCGRNQHSNQIDHTTEHARGGRTQPGNGGPLCGRHNRWKSRGYSAVRDADGIWRFHRPDGTELTEPQRRDVTPGAPGPIRATR